ncbi:MAG TPA: hypothetical protein V6D22_16375, partial [Candidatus Obscuribacterales bacterium]
MKRSPTTRQIPLSARRSIAVAFVLILCVGATPCVAQPPEQQWEKDLANVKGNWNPALTDAAIQRLEQELATATAAKDIAKQIAAHTALAQLFADSDLNKAFTHATSAINLWKQSGGQPSEKHHGESFWIMARYYGKNKQFREARDSYQQYR